MKKIVSVIGMITILLMINMTSVFAVTSAELPDKLLSIGTKYGMTATEKIKIERFISENPISDADANTIIAKVNEAAAVMDKAGVTDYKKLSKEKKEELKIIANSAANVVGVNLVFGTNSVKIYKNGKLIEEVNSSSNSGAKTSISSSASNGSKTTTSSKKLVYTGNTVNIVAVVSGVAVIALAVIAKKKFTNAK